jgi:hypothetical protein
MLAYYLNVATTDEEEEATKELYSTLHKAIGDRMSAMAPEDLLRVFTHDVKSASEFSEKLRVPEKAVILAESFFNEIREWLEGERLIDRFLLSIHRSRRLTQHQKQVLWCHPKAFNPQRRKRKVWLFHFCNLLLKYLKCLLCFFVRASRFIDACCASLLEPARLTFSKPAGTN